MALLNGEEVLFSPKVHQSWVEGYNTVADGEYAHAEGYETRASGDNSHAEGRCTTASGIQAHAEGAYSTASANQAHTEGYGTKAVGLQSHAEGYSTTANGQASHTEGAYSSADGKFAHAEGESTVASAQNAHAEGQKTKASGLNAHSEGRSTEASALTSHAEGESTKATASSAHAEGYGTVAQGQAAHSEGAYSKASARFAHAEGYTTEASGENSHAEGMNTLAAGKNQHVQGRWNIADRTGTYAHILGNGIDTARSNAFTVDWLGNGNFAGSCSSLGADYAEYFEWADGNAAAEDRVGFVVALEGEKIRLATAEDEDVLGIISGTAAVLGDTAEWEWCGKYLTDAFGRVITEHVEVFGAEKDEETGEEKQVSLGFYDVPKVNPDYDATLDYVRRKDRPEWAVVGMLGKLFVRDDGTCQVNGYACVGADGVLTASGEKTNIRVLSRTADNIIRVLLK